jgi:hypothetical protein
MQQAVVSLSLGCRVCRFELSAVVLLQKTRRMLDGLLHERISNHGFEDVKKKGRKEGWKGG